MRCLVQGEKRDREGKQDRQAQYEPCRQQEAPLEDLERRSEPVVLEQEPLIAPGHLVESVGGRLDKPPHELSERPGGRVDEDCGREQECKQVG